MLFLRILCGAVLLHMASGSTWAAETVVDFFSFTLTLPAGYKDHPGQGIDSQVGNITIAGKPFKIHYDSDPGGGLGERKEALTKLSECSKEALDGLIYYERVQDEPVATCITAWFHPNDVAKRSPIVSLEVAGFAGSFNIGLASKASLRDAIEALRAIKVKKPKKSAP